MKLFMDLFSSDVGLFSVATIAIVLGMGAFFVRYFITHMHADEARAAAQKGQAR